ncbi:aliphatic sulfonate ABC transporter substrate-binding protein [Arsenicitalea aurantiaca]|uniref:Aliphatic sulfonate ABC transporter substrate-binding protein n=1 Tax=Arsenicitalea aurantiaca TaxID=1783274 RepID=A0A433X2I9_9HYPH|nr:aliphatic sulfonate ABC transporter substrate-binding protein [Arsenicitalea aurantiaca]RUT28299.1 aliphatic sulfonate ABC transporter substrate-binding protein [Arsenicitalea aurantiaca]
MTIRRRTLIALGLAFLPLVAMPVSAQEHPERIAIGYGYATPSTLVLKETGWLEEQLADDGIAVEWILTRGSNQTLEFLRSGSIDFGSSAGSAAFLGHANGAPNKIVAWLSRGESTALLTLPDSGISSVEDLPGRKVAATRATEPYLFLQRALAEAGIAESEVEVVPLQHPEGRQALESGQVDAWAALDPDFSIAELRGAVVFHRDQNLITGGVLNAHADFVARYPQYVELVLQGIVWATEYIAENPDEAKALYAEAGGLEPDVAERAFARNILDQYQITDADFANVVAAGDVLRQSGSIPEDADLEATAQSLFAPEFIDAVLAR